jgi:small subunit ribosomal protein S16
MGKIRAPYYRIVVADSRTKRDGRVIEEIGKYHPTEDPSVIVVDSERAQYWLSVGAQPTEQVAVLLKLTGDWGTFKGEKGAKNTVRVAEPKEPFRIDAAKKPVLRPKVEKKVEVAAAEVAPEAEAVADAEVAPEPSEAPVEHEAAADVTPATEEPADETPVAEEAPVAEDAPAAEEAPVVEDAPAAVADEAPADEADKA